MNPVAATGSVSLITQLGRVIYRRATEDVIGMRLKQLIALDHLRANDSCLQQGLGQMLMLDPNNCVLLLNDLDEVGYVERQRDRSLRRDCGLSSRRRRSWRRSRTRCSATSTQPSAGSCTGSWSKR